jgi:hypothetical protein
VAIIDVTIQEKLTRLIKQDGYFRKKLEQELEDVAELVILPEYKRQMPVDKGFARKNADIFNISPLHKKVTTNVNNRGHYYMVSVHEGTGRYKGMADFGRVEPGYTRINGYTKEDRIRFASMAKKGKKFSIKPNKFSQRAYNITKPQAIKSLGAGIRRLINEPR